MRVNLLIAMIIFALIWPATALRAAVSKTTWADAPAREFVFVENNSDDNFFVTPGGALDPRLTGANRWTGLNTMVQEPSISKASATLITVTTPAFIPTGSLICGWKIHQFHLL